MTTHAEQLGDQLGMERESTAPHAEGHRHLRSVSEELEDRVETLEWAVVQMMADHVKRYHADG